MRPTFFCCFSHAGSSNPSRSHSSSSSIYPSYSCSDIFLVLRGMKSLSKWQNCCYPVGKLSLLVFLHGASVPPRQRSQSRDHFRRFYSVCFAWTIGTSLMWISRGEADLIYNVIADKASLQSTDSDYICIIISLHFYYEFLI